jgi:hypothetical protein
MNEENNQDQATDVATLEAPLETSSAVEAGETSNDGSELGDRMSLTDFINEFGDGLLSQVRSQNPAIYDPELDEGTPLHQQRAGIMAGLKRQPFKAQSDAVQAAVKLLVDHKQPAVVINWSTSGGARSWRRYPVPRFGF